MTSTSMVKHQFDNMYTTGTIMMKEEEESVESRKKRKLNGVARGVCRRTLSGSVLCEQRFGNGRDKLTHEESKCAYLLVLLCLLFLQRLL